MAFLQLSKVKLEYFQHGDGPERVVLIHGFQASAKIWRLVQQALPADRYTSIAINNRGAGASDAPPDAADFGCGPFAADAYELTQALGWRSFTMVGHSMGGATAAQFAVDHPDALKGLILLDPADPDGRAPPGVDLEALIDARLAARREQLARGGAGDGIDVRGADANVDLMRELAEDMRNAPERRLRGSMRSMFEIRIGERVGKLPMPVLLAGGDADALIPVASMLATWSKLPAGSGLHFWHGVGHSPNLDCPEAVAALIRQFVETTIPAKTKAREAQPAAAG
ncbi:MAG TPA: alpha/beta hydrolase [Caulobacteraceae bacterium]|nr:alpha/beta hydrolase [Caulobacteraceae bacterium]